MAHVVPFRGVYFDQARLGTIRDLVAPPYDVIDAAGQKALHDRHPNNVIRLELGFEQASDSETDNRYSRAARFLQDWLEQSVLKRDASPCMYLYRITYRTPERGSSATKTLTGFLANFKLAELDSGEIYPHENTRAAAKTDRLRLLEACRANFSPIWSLYSDPEGAVSGLFERAVSGKAPRAAFRDETGDEHSLWVIDDPAVLRQAVELMQPRPLFIADGHHRYETALNYQRLRRKQNGASQELQPYDQVLMLFSRLEDPGLTVLPTHRVLTKPAPPTSQLRALLEPWFETVPFRLQGTAEETARTTFLQALRDRGKTDPCFGLAVRGSGEYWLLVQRPQHRLPETASPRDRLDVSILQQQVIAKLCPTQQDLESIVYTKDESEALDWVAKGTAEGALLLNATKVDEVRAVAVAGERMPHKSTYFYPKPVTGLVLHVMEDRG
ncbi:hypothetical protein DNFV4_03556 [Nitrospira tepida]|uniref:DUF1015 domain-containing protein n=1 Tax=Nitrospira tepida TaxID=2973512 RepID=A0AA86TA04_9BACT|nr:DUF1015 domain-containing protein [Nitrospira tepida]CAI4033123.1 hypothetical protein DNFV4_03556 [Nitrospira tepida]